ncbi:MAG: type II toxin-antitoxin system ParD family antitoxin [Pyrinomonadaceae bacterium]
MNVSLTPELEALVNQKVSSGLYNSASEVIREGLRLFKEHDDLKRIQREELRRDILLGVEQVRQGKGQKYAASTNLAEEIKGRGRKRMKERRKGDR